MQVIMAYNKNDKLIDHLTPLYEEFYYSIINFLKLDKSNLSPFRDWFSYLFCYVNQIK